MPARTPRTPITPYTPDEDLDVAWKKTIARCQAIAKWDLDDRSAPSIEDIVAKIQPAKLDEKKSNRTQAKEVVRGTLVCIQRFGQIAAQGASMVFGPSQQCFNAISFVINVTQDISTVFANLTALMERISVFLERLRTYMDSAKDGTILDKRLRRPVYEVLEHFVLIMSKSYKLTSGVRGKIKLGLKVTLLGEDEGVKDALATLETLVSDVTGAEISAIAQDVSEAAKNIRSFDKKLDHMSVTLDTVKAIETRREDADKEQKDTEVLRKALGIEDKKEPWLERQGELWRTHVPESGRWLLDYRMPSFARWADSSEFSVGVLSLKAEQNFGKSYLTSLVIDHLVAKYNRLSSKAAVAYYYFQKDSSETRDSGSDTINKALKAIVWQWTQAGGEASREYRKRVAKLCGEKPDLSRTSDLWRILVADLQKSLSATFYLILDGVDAARSEHGDPLAIILKEMMTPKEELPQLEIRLFVTGRPSALDAITQQIGFKLPEISLALPARSDEPALNESDILLYADDQLSRMPVFRDEGDADKSLLKERIKLVLSSGVRGDFYNLNDKLSEVKNAQNFDQLEAILLRANEDRLQVIRRKINDLNERLLADEIEEINQLLIWVTRGIGVFTIEELTAALRLRSKRTNLFLPLDQRIRDRYSALFVVDDEPESDVRLSSDDILDFLMNHQDHSKPRPDFDPRTNEGAFHEAEIALLQRIVRVHLHNVFGSDSDMYERYGFEDFFESKRSPSNARIHFDEEKAHVVLAQACLIALCDRYEETEFQPIRFYSFTYFADHIRNQIDFYGLERTDDIAKQEIGRRLATLLYEPVFIEAWSKEWLRYRSFWIDMSDARDAVLTWLRDPACQTGLQDMPRERRWVNSLFAQESLSIRLLDNVAVVVARLWFASEPGDNLKAVEWLLAYHNEVQGKPQQLPEEMTLEKFEYLETWAKGQLQNDHEEAQWHFVVGLSMSQLEHHKDALPRLRQSLDLRPDFWRAEVEFATATGDVGDRLAAIAALSKTLEARAELLDSNKNFAERYWLELLPALVDWNEVEQKYADAEVISRKLFEHKKQELVGYNFEAENIVIELLRILVKQKKYGDVMELAQELSEKRDEFGDDWLSAFIVNNVDDWPIRSWFIAAVAYSDSVKVMVQHLERAEAIITRKDSLYPQHRGPAVIMWIRGCIQHILWRLGSELNDEEVLSEMESLARRQAPESDVDCDFKLLNSSRSDALVELRNALLTSALRTASDDPSSSPYVERLRCLGELDDNIISFVPQDPRRYIARAYFLSDKLGAARDVSRNSVGLALQIIRERALPESAEVVAVPADEYSLSTLEFAAVRLSKILMAVDDDENAVAAWSIRTWTRREQQTEPVSESPNPNGTTSSQGEDSHPSPLDDAVPRSDLAQLDRDNPTKISADDEPSQADAGAQESTSPASDVVQSPNSATLNQKPKLPHIDTSSSFSDGAASSAFPQCSTNKEQAQSSWVRFCDGLCGRTFDYPCDLYYCRECFAVFMCKDCYDGFKAGTLVTKPCDILHSHLYIPPFQSDGTFYVGGKLTPLKDWLEKMMKDWGVEEQCNTMRERMNNARRKILRAANAKGALELARETSLDRLD